MRSHAGMHIYVEARLGEKTLTLDVEPWYTIVDVREQLDDLTKSPNYDKVLMLDGRILDSPGSTLNACGIKDGSILRLITNNLDGRWL